jgi:hypothetical protein
MKRVLVIAAALFTLMLPSLAANAYAYNPLDSACGAGGGAAGSTGCGSDGSDPISGSNGILMKASLVVSALAGLSAVFIIIIAGCRCAQRHYRFGGRAGHYCHGARYNNIRSK